jgi:hypothetical protein
MTVEQQQQLADAVMHRMALRHGSSKRRDFEVVCLTLDLLIKEGLLGSATDSANAEHSDATHRSNAP